MHFWTTNVICCEKTFLQHGDSLQSVKGDEKTAVWNVPDKGVPIKTHIFWNLSTLVSLQHMNFSYLKLTQYLTIYTTITPDIEEYNHGLFLFTKAVVQEIQASNKMKVIRKQDYECQVHQQSRMALCAEFTGVCYQRSQLLLITTDTQD